MKRRLIVLSFLPILLVVFFANAQLARAQSQSVSSGLIENETAIHEGATRANKERFDSDTLNNLGYNLIGWMAGCSVEKPNCPEELSDGGAIGTMGRAIAMTYTQPANTQTYIADLMQNMGLAQPAYAQGLGFSSLQPILELWKVFRNIAYIFFVFVFLIIGFAIMFRQKLGGQAAVTVQQALPRIIVALLAVSFSYAIAGLIIDLMYVLMFFIIVIFQSSGLIDAEVLDITAQNTNSFILNKNIFQVFGSIITFDNLRDAGAIVGNAVEEFIGSGGIANAAGDTLGWLSGILAALIIFFAIVFAMFRTFFSLIKIYLEIILSIVFAPIILMLGAINGNAFGNWLKSLVVNLAVFPVLLVFIIVGFMFINSGDSGSPELVPAEFESQGFVPPFFPGRGQAETISLVVGIAAIMLLPEVTGIVGKYKPASVFQDLGGLAWANATKGKDAGLRAGFGIARAPIGAGLGYVEGSRYGRGGMGALAGAALGAYGPRRAYGIGSKALNQYGEFAENLPGFADSLEQGIADRFGRRGASIANLVRTRRKGGKTPVVPRNMQDRERELPYSEQLRRAGTDVGTGKIPFDAVESDDKITNRIERPTA